MHALCVRALTGVGVIFFVFRIVNGEILIIRVKQCEINRLLGFVGNGLCLSLRTCEHQCLCPVHQVWQDIGDDMPLCVHESRFELRTDSQRLVAHEVEDVAFGILARRNLKHLPGLDRAAHLLERRVGNGTDGSGRSNAHTLLNTDEHIGRSTHQL